MCVYIYIYTWYIYIYIYIHTCILTSCMCMYIYIYMYTHVHMCIYIYITHIHNFRGHQTCHFRKCATSVPAEGPAYGLDFERHCESPLRAPQAQKWRVQRSSTFGAAWAQRPDFATCTHTQIGEEQWETCRGGQTTQNLRDVWTSQPEQVLPFSLMTYHWEVRSEAQISLRISGYSSPHQAPRTASRQTEHVTLGGSTFQAALAGSGCSR